MTVKRKPHAGRSGPAVPASKGNANRSSITKTARQVGPKRVADLDPRVVAHFESSGLETELLQRMQVELVPPRKDPVVPIPLPAFRIRYFDLDGNPIDFYRLRVEGSYLPKGLDKPIRYMQPAGSECRLYFAPVLPDPWRRYALDPTLPILITEGEKKAAKACACGFVTIGLGGVWNWRQDGSPIGDLDLIEWSKRPVFVVFDSPDVQDNKNVTDAALALGAELSRRGAIVKFVHLGDGPEKVGLDDFLVTHGPEALSSLLETATDEPMDAVARLNREIALVRIGAKSMVLREELAANGEVIIGLATDGEVAPKYANDLVKISTPKGPRWLSAFKVWSASKRRREYDGLDFYPGEGRPGYYNLWRGFPITPTPGDCGLLLEHIRAVICSGNDEHYRYLMRWMAHAIQKPWELPETAVVLMGPPGSGKGVFARTFGRLFGQSFVHLSDRSHLVGKFNAHLCRALVVFADEAVWGGNKESEGVLKAMITEPHRMLEHKGKDPQQIRNFVRLMVASNEDFPVPVGFGDRRMFPLEVSGARVGDGDYFKALQRQLDAGGIEAFMHHLSTLDIADFNPRERPKTEALQALFERTLTGPDRFWYDCLWKGCNNEDSGGWDTEVPKALLHRMYAESAQLSGERRRRDETQLGVALKKLLPSIRTAEIRSGGPQRPHWTFPSLEDSRRAFERIVGWSVDWPPVVPVRKNAPRPKPKF